MSSESLFELTNATKRYGRITALQGLNVSVPQGAIGLLGPNGAGKTTMIRSLLGLIVLSEGEGRVLGLDIHQRQRQIRQIVGFVPEDETLFPGLKGVEFVAYAGELCGMPRSDALQRAHEVLDYAGLGEARYRAVESFSTGMKQRLKLAAAIVHDPQLLILDEPTNGLDPAGRLDMLALAKDLAHQKGMSLLFSSHLLPDVEEVCEHVIVLGGGKLLKQGRIAELKLGHEGTYLVRLKLKSDAEQYAGLIAQRGARVAYFEDNLLITLPEGHDTRLFWETAREAGLQIRRLEPQESTLEEVFFQALQGA